MAKKKHTKKNPVVICSDANQHARESLKELARVAAAKQKKFEELREMYMNEMKRREEESKKDSTPSVISPTATPEVEKDVANK